MIKMSAIWFLEPPNLHLKKNYFLKVAKFSPGYMNLTEINLKGNVDLSQ